MIPDEVLKSGRELKLLWANGYGESTKPSADVYHENLNPFSVSFLLPSAFICCFNTGLKESPRHYHAHENYRFAYERGRNSALYL